MADIYEDVSRIQEQQAAALLRLTRPDLSRMSIPELEAELAQVEADRARELAEAQAEREQLKAFFSPQIAALQELVTHLEKIAGVVDFTSYFDRGVHLRAQDAGYAQRHLRGFEGRDGIALHAVRLAISVMEDELARPVTASNAGSHSQRARDLRSALHQKQSAKAQRLALLREELDELGMVEP